MDTEIKGKEKVLIHPYLNIYRISKQTRASHTNIIIFSIKTISALCRPLNSRLKTEFLVNWVKTNVS